MNSIASKSPIVRWMVLNVISSGEIEVPKARHRIDNEMVPSLSHRTHHLSRGFQESKFQINPHNSSIEHPVQQQAVLGGYGRLTPLINDPAVNSIESPGENLPIKIIRLGRPIITTIVLSQIEIDSILKYVSERTRIPLENQVFKVAIDNILFNALVSKELGTRFMIKKNFQISKNYEEAFR
jgi:hypothetical protein